MDGQVGCSELLERVTALERQNRRFRRGGFTAFVLTVSLFSMAQIRAGRTVEASRFLLVDGKGKARAELGLLLDRPSLAFYDDRGEAVLRLGFDRGEAALLIRDSVSDRHLVLGGAAGPSLTFNNPKGQRRLWLGFAGQSPALGLIADTGEAKAALGLANDSSPYLQLFGEQERGGMQLTVAPTLTALRFLDAAERTRAVLGLLEKAPGLSLNDDSGSPRGIFMLTPAGPALDLLGPNKSTLWHAP